MDVTGVGISSSMFVCAEKKEVRRVGVGDILSENNIFEGLKDLASLLS